MKILRAESGRKSDRDAMMNAKETVYSADVVILDGVIIKNRDGAPGGRIGRSLLVWKERKMV